MADYRGITTLTGDKRTREVKHWIQWAKQVPGIRRKFCRWTEDFDPFHFNEAASVAVLANAAVKAGYLAHTEYVALKRSSSRGRPFRAGRCDLWIADVDSELRSNSILPPPEFAKLPLTPVSSAHARTRRKSIETKLI